MPGQVTHFYTAARMAREFKLDPSDDVMPCVQDGINKWLAANDEFHAAAHRINKENTWSSDDDLDAAVKKYRKTLLDTENIAIFSAFAAGAVGPDLWTIPGSSIDALAPWSKMIDGSWYFDMGHYNSSHVFPAYTLWQIKSNYGSWKTLQRKYRTAYILGFISHICTDIVVHPLVNVFAGAYHQQTQAAWEFERSPIPTKKWNDHNKIEHFWDGVVRYLCFEGYHSSLPAAAKQIRGKDFGQSNDWNFPNYTDYWSKVLDSTIDDLSDKDELLLDVSTSLAGPFGQCYDVSGERKVEPFIREYFYDSYDKVDDYISKKHEGSLHPGTVKDEIKKLEFFYLEYKPLWLSTQQMYLGWNLPSITDTFSKGEKFYELSALGQYLQMAIKLGTSYIQKSLDYIKNGTENDLLFLHNWNLDLGHAIRVKELADGTDPTATVPVCIDLVNVYDDEALQGMRLPSLSTALWQNSFSPAPAWTPKMKPDLTSTSPVVKHSQKIPVGSKQSFVIKPSQPVSVQMRQVTFYDGPDCSEIAAYLFGSVEKADQPWAVIGDTPDTYTLKGYKIEDCVEDFTPVAPYADKTDSSALGKKSQKYSTVYKGGTGTSYIAEGDSEASPKTYYVSKVERCMPRHLRVAWCRKYTCTPNTSGKFEPASHNRHSNAFPSEEMVLSVFSLLKLPSGEYRDLFYDVVFTQAQMESLLKVKVIGVNTIVLLFKVNEKGSLRMYEAWVDGQKQIVQKESSGPVKPPIPGPQPVPPAPTPDNPDQPGGDFVEIPDVLFNHNSAIPILDDKSILISSLLTAHTYAKERPSKEVVLFGHTDTSGGPDYNFTLSQWRAEAIKALMDGNVDLWNATVKNCSKVEDYQSILKTLKTTYNWDCDPGTVDNSDGPKTKRAVGAFQCTYNSKFDGKLKVDGTMGPKTWEAMFFVIRYILTDACKDASCDGISFTYGYSGKGIYPCGESFPIENKQNHNCRSQKNRRVEIMFFDKGKAPALRPPKNKQKITLEEAPVYDDSKVIIQPVPQSEPPQKKGLFDSIVDKIKGVIGWAGFEYDSKQGIFYSKVDAWQHNVGYFEIYDKAAPFTLMFIHCEPIKFKYDNRSWNIELWKGQYGISTGAEIGIYVGEFQVNTGIDGVDHTMNRLNFGKDTACASGDDMLVMSFVLKKNGKTLFTRDSDDPATSTKETHWWLTGFKPGEFSDASELVMDLSITFKDVVMRDAFVDALIGMGYSSSGIRKTSNKVSFTYGQPKSKQPW